MVGGAAYGVYQYVGQKPGVLTLPKGELGEPTVIQEQKGPEPTAKPTTVAPTSKEPEQKEKSETPSTKGNFSQKGAIFAGEDGWVLLWDEPGRMALTVRLIFTDKSTCIFGGEEKDCGLINMGPESYDYASVEGNRDDGEVTVIKLEELKLPQ